MYFFGVLNLVALFICCFMIPSELNRTNKTKVRADLIESQNEEAEKQEEAPMMKIGWCTILCNRHALFAILTCFVGTFNIVFF